MSVWKKLGITLISASILGGALNTTYQAFAETPASKMTLKNVVKKKIPTTNSTTLIEGALTTIPAVAIKNPDLATDGKKGKSTSEDTSTKIIAGKETGGNDNGYATWNPVYLQYEFDTIAPITKIAIYRNSFDNALITFKKVKVELSKTPDFKPENTETVFVEQDVTETTQTKGKPQNIELPKPIDAKYIRVWGQGEYIQNTNGSWKGYSNGVLINELEVFANVPEDAAHANNEKSVNLAALKLPFVSGLAPTNLAAINDGKQDDNYAVANGNNAVVKWEFKNSYQIKEIKIKLKPGDYSYISVSAGDSDPTKLDKVLFNKFRYTASDKEVLSIPVKTEDPLQYIGIWAIRKDGQPAAYSEIEIWGVGDNYDEKMPDYVAPASPYNQLVWSDEFNGDKVDESKWQIIDGMWNHAAIYNRGAVSIKKDGENSYLSLRSKNYNSTEELIKAVGYDPYDDTPMKKKVTWSSGRVEAKDKYSFQNGRIAVRAKVNDSKGIWPAIWMLAQDETGHDELDILEYLGQNAWDAWTTNHFGILGRNKESDGKSTRHYEAWSQQFHVYEVEWSPESIKWFIDGEPVFESQRGKGAPKDAMHTRPMFPILETQVGDGWVGDVDYTKQATKQDSEFLIDWVRVYQKENQDVVYFDNLDDKVPNPDYDIRPLAKLGQLTAVSNGDKPYENKNHFFYGGQPRYETSRLLASNDEQENALVYQIDNPTALHLTTYYRTLDDYSEYNKSAWAKEGKSIRNSLLNQANIDFKVYSSSDNKNWTEEQVSVVDNFVDATPAFTRTTFDVKQFSQGVKYVKVVFPKTTGVQYTLNNGTKKDVAFGDVQLAKVIFTAPHKVVKQTKDVVASLDQQTSTPFIQKDTLLNSGVNSNNNVAKSPETVIGDTLPNTGTAPSTVFFGVCSIVLAGVLAPSKRKS